MQKKEEKLANTLKKKKIKCRYMYLVYVVTFMYTQSQKIVKTNNINISLHFELLQKSLKYTHLYPKY